VNGSNFSIFKEYSLHMAGETDENYLIKLAVGSEPGPSKERERMLSINLNVQRPNLRN
jgi:hypothetical protein